LCWPGRRSPGFALLGWGLFAGLAAVALPWLWHLRYVVLPKVADYQSEIEQAASRAVGQPVKIGKIDGALGWAESGSGARQMFNFLIARACRPFR
jgi:hypothetical protein